MNPIGQMKFLEGDISKKMCMCPTDGVRYTECWCKKYPDPEPDEFKKIDGEKIKKWLAGNSARSGNMGKMCRETYQYINQLEDALLDWLSSEVK